MTDLMERLWAERVAANPKYAAVRDGTAPPAAAAAPRAPRTIRANPPDPVAIGENGRADRPGTELKAMLASIGLGALDPSPRGGCRPCDDWVRAMDEWGPKGCREHRAEIVARLEEQRAKLPTLDFLAATARAFATGLVFRIDPLDPCGSLVDEAVRRSERNANARTVLLDFPHGLGDAVQLTAVLRHLKKHRPEWEIDVLTWPGRGSVLRGHCRRAFAHGEPRDRTHDRTIYIPFPEQDAETKPAHCLRKQFGLEPEPELMAYAVTPSDDDRAAAESYYRSLGLTRRPDGRWPVVVAHHKGNSSSERKSLPDAALVPLADACRDRGLALVVLDWDNRTGRELADRPGVTVHAPEPDGGRIAGLIELAAAWVGIDSGPGHVGGGTSTPGVVVWTLHHPLRFYDPCPDVLHLVPEHLDRLPPGAGHRGRFERLHRHAVYKDLAAELPGHALARLSGNPMPDTSPLKATSYDRDYYDEHRAAGLDYLGHGDWQEQYGRWLVGSLGWAGAAVLDVGCACGSIAEGLRTAGARPTGIDLNNHAVGLGRARFPAVPLYVCDAVNLHLFADAAFDGLHCNQVAEHWRPDLVPLILAELARVVRPGGLLFLCLDTEELFARQGRDLAAEDPTHVCVRPAAWWAERLAAAGFVPDPDAADRLRKHPESFLSRYDWDWFALRRAAR